MIINRFCFHKQLLTNKENKILIEVIFYFIIQSICKDIIKKERGKWSQCLKCERYESSFKRKQWK